jgi:acyl-CoA synthetase (AMP-forming)/AMP-acid ligase II
MAADEHQQFLLFARVGIRTVIALQCDDADGAAAAALSADLIAYCREHLADVKCPRSVDFRTELPRHPTGKLYKRLLKDKYVASA